MNSTLSCISRCHIISDDEPISLSMKKNQSPSALARSSKRHTCFLEKKLAGKPDLALPEEKNFTVPGVPDAVDSLSVKELENRKKKVDGARRCHMRISKGDFGTLKYG